MSSATGTDLLSNYYAAVNEVRRFEEALTAARDRAREAEQALGAWIDPGDMRVGETLGVWVRPRVGPEVLVQATRTAEEYVVRERKVKAQEGKSDE